MGARHLPCATPFCQVPGPSVEPDHAFENRGWVAVGMYYAILQGLRPEDVLIHHRSCSFGRFPEVFGLVLTAGACASATSRGHQFAMATTELCDDKGTMETNIFAHCRFARMHVSLAEGGKTR